LGVLTAQICQQIAKELGSSQDLGLQNTIDLILDILRRNLPPIWWRLAVVCPKYLLHESRLHAWRVFYMFSTTVSTLNKLD
jgi:hypothetical protein